MKTTAQMKQQKQQTKTTAHPAEEQSAVRLRAAVAELNGDALTRSTLADANREQLARLEVLAGEYQAEARKAWPVGTDRPPAVESIVALVSDYRNVCTSSVHTTLSGVGTIETPAIESQTVRTILSNKGDALIEQISEVIEIGHRRLAAEQEALSALDKQVRHWLGVTVVRHLVLSLIDVIDEQLFDDGNSEPYMLTRGILETMRLTQLYLHNANPTWPQPLVTPVGMWRQWMPVAREVLGAEQRQEAAA